MSPRHVIDEMMKRADLDINQQDAAGSPAWIYGIEAGRCAEMIDAMFWNKALDVNGLVHYWETPLIHSVRTGNELLFDALLARDDIRVNSRDIRSDSTPLMWAVRYGRISMVRKLIKRADVIIDCKDGNLDSVFMRAVRQGFTDGVLALLAVTPTQVEAELATEREYRRKLLLDRDEQVKKNAEAEIPLPEPAEDEGEGDSDVDDGDEDTEWAGKSTITKVTQATDSLASTDNGQVDEYPDEGRTKITVESDDDEDKRPPDPLLYQVFANAQVADVIKSQESKWRDRTIPLHDRDVKGWTGLVWAAHNGCRDVLLPMLSQVRPDGTPEIRLEVQPLNPDDVKADGGAGVEEPSLDLSEVSLGNMGVDAHKTLLTHRTHGSGTIVSGMHSYVAPKPPKKMYMQEPLGVLSSHWLYARSLINYRTNDGDTALMWAVKEDHIHIVKALLGQPWIDPEAVDAHGYTALLVALRQHQWHHVEALLRCPHTCTDAVGPDGISGLMYCIRNRYWDMIRLFIATSRVKVNQQDPEGWTPLTIALRDNDMELFHMFYDCKRTDLNCPNGAGDRPLGMACSVPYQMEVVDLLVHTPDRCDINAANATGKTPIMLASMSGLDEGVQLFMKQQTLDWRKTDKEGKTIVDIAKTSPSFLVCRMVRGRHKLFLYVPWGAWLLRLLCCRC